MIPVLFERDEVDFQSNGIGQLPNVIDSYAYEIGNAEYELNLVYPTVNDIDGYPNSIWKELKVTERQILYKPSHSRKPHAFRIYNYEIDSIAQTITVYGRSRAYDLGNNVVKTVSINNQTPQIAMNIMKANLIEPTDFDFYSDMSTTSSTKWERQSGLSTIMGEEGSLIQYWGGEVLRENTRISLYNRVGKDNVTTLRLGKNIQQLNYDLRTDNMVTAIIPFYRYTPEGENQEEIVVTGNTVKSSKFNNYRLPYYQFVEYNEQDDNVTNLTTLNNAASKWFSEHPNVDEPTLTINVDMVDVAESTEYAELLKSLEQVNVFDTVSVYVAEYDIDMVIKVVSLKYDGFNERNLEVELGSPSSGLFETFVNPHFDNISKQLDEVRKIGVTAQISADGKNTNYQGSIDPNEAGLVGDDGDIYFRTVGTEKQMWQYQVNQWNLILDTSRIDVVEKEVLAIIAQAETDRTEAEQNFTQAVIDAATYTDTKVQEFDNKLVAVNQEVANVTQAANAAVSKADQAIQDVGFMQTDVNTAKTNAVEALTKAQKATEDVNVLTTDFDELTQTVSLKAEKTVVDSVKNTVDQHSLDISANAQAINARLTSAQVDTLLAGKKYVNETTLNATANGLSASITQVSTDLNNLEIGGRNYFSPNNRARTLETVGVLFEGQPVYTIQVNYEQLTNRIIINGNEDISISVWVKKSSSDSTAESVVLHPVQYTTESGSVRSHSPSSTFTVTNEWQRIVYKPTTHAETKSMEFYVRTGPSGATNASVFVSKIMIEKGHKVTDWTPAPEDMATLEQFTTIDATVKGLQTTVGNKAEQSQVTQLAGQISSKVESATYNSKMTQLDSAINLRVTKGDVTAQINVEAGVTLISNKKLLLDANTYIMGTTFANDVKAKSLEAVYADIATLKTKVLTADVITSTMIKSDTALIDKMFATTANIDRLTSKAAFIADIKAIDISADKVTTGTLNAANVNLINVNVSSLVGNTSSFIQSNWNAINSNININGTEITLTSYDSNSVTRFYNSGFDFHFKGTKVGRLGLNYTVDSTKAFLSLSAEAGQGMNFAKKLTASSTTFDTIFEVPTDSLELRMQKTLNINGQEIREAKRIFTPELTVTNGLTTSAIGEFFSSGSIAYLNGTTQLIMQIGRVSKASITASSFNLHTNLNANGNSLLNMSTVYFGTNQEVKKLNANVLDVTSNTQLRLIVNNFTMIDIIRSSSTSTGINVHANLNMQGNIVTGTSDRRLKKNVHSTAMDSLSAIKHWNFVNYEWIDTTKPQGTHLGLIAQDTPELVIYDPVTDLYSINNSKQTMMNSHAIQQLNKKIEELEQKIQQLESAA